jgi:hypothetical protein
LKKSWRVGKLESWRVGEKKQVERVEKAGAGFTLFHFFFIP